MASRAGNDSTTEPVLLNNYKAWGLWIPGSPEPAQRQGGVVAEGVYEAFAKFQVQLVLGVWNFPPLRRRYHRSLVAQAGVTDSEVWVLHLKGRLRSKGIAGISSLVPTAEEPSHLGHRDSEAGLEYCV